MIKSRAPTTSPSRETFLVVDRSRSMCCKLPHRAFKFDSALHCRPSVTAAIVSGAIGLQPKLKRGLPVRLSRSVGTAETKGRSQPKAPARTPERVRLVDQASKHG